MAIFFDSEVEPSNARGNSAAVPMTSTVPRTLCLVGFMGAGKTAVGRALAQHLSWEFEDLHARIESVQGQTIPEIFSSLGEAAFRGLEHQTLRSLLESSDAATRVVALGGGAYAQSENRGLLEAAGARVIFLDAPVEELFERCQAQGVDRPLRRELQAFRELYDARRPAYLKAHWQVATQGKAVDELVLEVAKKLELSQED